MDPDSLSLSPSVSFDPVRRDALDKLYTFFLGPITQDEAERLNKTLYSLAEQRHQQFQQTGRLEKTPFTIFINSPGGDVDAGLAVMNMVFRVQREYGFQVQMVVLGTAYSMAAIILQSASRRIMEPFSTMLVHAPKWAIAASEDVIFKDYEKLAEGQRRTLAHFFAQRSGKHDATWWEEFLYSREERFLFPAECLELGLVDEVLPAFVLDQGNLTPPASAPAKGG